VKYLSCRQNGRTIMADPAAIGDLPSHSVSQPIKGIFRDEALTNLLLLLPAVALIALVFVLPLALVLKNSVLTRNGLSFFYFAKFLSDPFYLSVLWRTLRLGSVGALATFLPGYVLAFNMVFHPSRRFRTFIVAVTMIPLVVNLVIRVFGWITILSPAGTIHEILSLLGFDNVRVNLLFTEEAIVIGLVHSHLTFMVLPIVAALSKIDLTLLRAAEDLGANSWRTFYHVILPLSLPGVVSGSLLCFALNISDFVVPALMGGERIRMMTYLIYEQQLFLANDYFAAAQTVILMTVASLAVLGSLWLAARFGRRFAA
jgi:putative spermidine/putrescine transport system permease protein